MLVSTQTEPVSIQEEARIAALKRYSILDSLPERAYDDLTHIASMICGTPISLVSLVDTDRQWFKSEHGLGVRETPRSESFCAHTLATAQTLIIEDALQDPRFAENPLVLGYPGIRFYAGAPIIEPSGSVLGTLCVIDTKPRVLTAEQISALEALARQVVTLLELRLTIELNAKAADALRTAEKLSAVGRLASVVAHEINNPLQSLTNLLYMAQAAEEKHNSIDIRALLRQSQQELARVSQIVTQTLRFHRQSLHPAPAMLADLVTSVLDLFQSRLTRASISIQTISRQSIPLLCYSSDLRQVVANLIGNALDAVSTFDCDQNTAKSSYIPAIHVRIRDAISPTTGQPGIRLTVADNGCGMSATTLANLFQPFFSTKGTRGTGLGLWVSKAILEKHHAVVKVLSSQSPAHHGTAFSFFFPQQFPHSPDSNQPHLQP